MSLPDNPSYESGKEALDKVEPSLDAKILNNRLVKSMLKDGWVIHSYQFSSPDFAEVVFSDPAKSRSCIKGIFLK